MQIHLNIDQIILDGYPLDATGRAALQSALEAELSTLLAQGRLTPELLAGANLASLAAAPLGSAAPTPASLGKQLAQSVAGSLTGGSKP